MDNQKSAEKVLTFKELKEQVGTSEGHLPSAKSLRERADVIAHEVQGNAEATVFLSGHILYTKETMSETISKGHIVPLKVKHSAVYTVDRCKEMKSDFYGEMDEETADGYRQQGLIVKDGCLYLPESMYEDLPWFEVISMICEERLDHNQESREGSHTDFSLDNDGNDWDEHTWLPDFVEEMFRQQDEEEKDAGNHKKLMLALDSLTEKQRMVVKLYFGKEGMTEKKVADKLGISQQAVHKSLAAAVRKIRTFF